jgi:hypothetical protein
VLWLSLRESDKGYQRKRNGEVGNVPTSGGYKRPVFADGPGSLLCPSCANARRRQTLVPCLIESKARDSRQGRLHGALPRQTQLLSQRTPSPQILTMVQQRDGSSAAKMIFSTRKKLKLRAMGGTDWSRSKWYTSLATIAAP